VTKTKRNTGAPDWLG